MYVESKETIYGTLEVSILFWGETHQKPGINGLPEERI